jgi:DNA-binding transcriptional LysR family regulator
MDTIDSMRAFLAVADEGNFTKAANKLGQTVNMVSKKVAALEARLAVQLLNRTTRHVSPTETGRSYAEECRRLLEDFDAVERSATRTHTSPKGHLKIAAPTNFGERFVAPAAARFLSEYPDITAEVCLADRFVDIVAEGFDVALRIGTLEDSSVIAKKLAATDLHICASPEYLAKHGTPSNPADLSAHSCVIDTNVRTGEQWPFEIDGKSSFVKISGRLKVNSAEAARAATLNGAGISICPAYIVKEDIGAGKLVRLFGAMPAPNMGIYALYPHNRHLAAKVCSFVRFLQQHFKEEFQKTF